jgi:hypothetical protein
MKNPVTPNGTPATVDDLAHLTARPVKPYSDLWVKKIEVFLFKRRKETDAQ